MFETLKVEVAGVAFGGKAVTDGLQDVCGEKAAGYRYLRYGYVYFRWRSLVRLGVEYKNEKR